MKLEVRIIPNASKDSITGFTEDGALKVRVQAPPVDGAANKRLIKLLAKSVGVSKSRVKIISGEKARIKLVEIDADKQQIQDQLKGIE